METRFDLSLLWESPHARSGVFSSGRVEACAEAFLGGLFMKAQAVAQDPAEMLRRPPGRIAEMLPHEAQMEFSKETEQKKPG